MFQSLVSDTEKGGKASNGDAGGADGDHLVVSTYIDIGYFRIILN